MKIAILTHRLGHNYGGILQAYALQKIISKYNPSGETVTFHRHSLPSAIFRTKRSIYISMKSKRVFLDLPYIDKVVASDTKDFISKYIKTESFEKVSRDSEVLIVGSDQVWRASYVDPVKYMFDGMGGKTTTRISYAASFGTDDLGEYSAEQVAKTAELAKGFSGFSVRESSGVDIISNNWNLRANHHVDPTLLLDAFDYEEIISKETTRQLDGNLFVYVLDRSTNNNMIIEQVEKFTNAKKFELLPKDYNSLFHFIRNKKAYVMPKVEQWLRSFKDAEFVVTDSFHGTVFSIIFNKPFVAVGNKGRGLARFESLLSMFGLEHRLVTSEDEITKKLVDEKINWALVNQKIKKEQKRSEEYLRKYIQ